MDYLNVPWYVVVDDVVGGWAVATVDAPVSEFLGYGEGRSVADGFWDESHARHVVELHDAWLGVMGY